jgi:hypothetical protein
MDAEEELMTVVVMVAAVPVGLTGLVAVSECDQVGVEMLSLADPGN